MKRKTLTRNPKSEARNPRSDGWESQLRKLMTPVELGTWMRAERTRLIESIDSTDAFAWMTLHTRLIDLCLMRLLEYAWQEASKEVALRPDHPLAIIATGGYGRCELAPYSDIDLTFVPLQEGDPFTDRLVKHLFHALMESFHTIAGLKIGYAYRLMEDCASLDAKTRTGLLDMRLVAGSGRLYARFESTFWEALNPTAFLFERYDEYRARLDKYGQSALVCEPDLKEGAGGLRDFHTLRWMTQVRYNVPGKRVPLELVQQGWLTEDEARQVSEAYNVLSRLRLLLHSAKGEARDVLVRTRQDEMALRTGFKTKGGESNVPNFMRILLHHMHTLHTLCARAIEGIIRSRLVLGVGLDCVNREIVPANASLQREPLTWCLYAFRNAQQYKLSLGHELQQQIREIGSRQSAVERQGDKETTHHSPLTTHHSPDLNAEIGHYFKLLLNERGQVYRVLRPMADLGVLNRALPELGEVFYLVPPDPTHEYSVGEHTLQAVRILDALWNEPDETQAPLRMIFEEISRPEVLYLALLLHDVGKHDAVHPHAEIGAELAREVATRWGWEERACTDVEFLVRHHLLMAQTARQRDLHLEETIREFTRTVDDIERLQMLYLLTYADTRAVGERIWTPAQASFVHELYKRAARALHEEEPGVPDLTSVRKRLLRELSKHPLPPEAVEEHIQQMPSSYLLNVPLEQITLHIHYVQRALQGEPVIEFHNTPASPYTEMTVCTRDDPKPGLLSKIAGVLYAADAEVHAARVFTREDGEKIALDTLWVDYRGRPLSPAKCTLLERDLRAVLTGARSVENLLQEKGKDPATPLQVYRVQVHHDVSEQYTVVDFQTPADPGALYRAARTLSSVGWNIHSARLGQWAGRTVTSFYVTDTRGDKIAPEHQGDLERLIERADRGS